MKELNIFRQFLAEGQLNENMDPQDLKTLKVTIDRFLTQGDEGPAPKAGDVLTYEWEDDDMEIKDEVPGEFVKFDENEAAKYEVRKVGGNEYEFKVTAKVDVSVLEEEQVEEQVEGKVYVVMVGRPGEPKGPIKAFMDKASAEQHAVQFKQDYEDRFKGNELSSFIQEVPMG